ncbi:uncharacterized protein TNCV_4034721 [Trichonephila clavipes]|nr:uncharacterized protein TNCV_4034721 [Trichonephila clavipes]
MTLELPSTDVPLSSIGKRPDDLAGQGNMSKFWEACWVETFTCRNCGGGDRGRVAIYRPFGEVSLSLNRTVTCMVLKANDRRTSCPCHDEFRGPRSDYVRQVSLGYLMSFYYTLKVNSDEAHFWLNGYVNKQNCRIWSEANPQVYVETPLHPEKLTVWCALWAGGILLQKQ